VKLAGLGFLGIFLFQLCWNFGLAQTTAGKASILVSTTPLFAALGAALIGRVPGPVAWAGMALGFGGVFLLINNSLAEITVGGGTWIGDVLMLIASIVWAFYSVYAVDLIRRLGALTATTWAMIFGTLMLLPFTLVPTLEADWAALAPETWGAFLFTSVFSAALSFFWWYEGVRLIGPEKAMLYSYLIPVFGVCAAAFLAGEVMSWVQLLGAVLALGGVALARRG
ncbi:MAG: DMT family transporter, partial [Alphaproteobacteria bacterium]|nr:DMT family transporter [Alphaproteobacteria bacterium]